MLTSPISIRRRFTLGLLVFCFSLFGNALNAAESRTVWGVYNSDEWEPFSRPNVAVYFELPLNHLGMKLELVDVAKPLPDLTTTPLPHGIILNVLDLPANREDAYWTWVAAFQSTKRPIVFLDGLGPSHGIRDDVLARLNVRVGPVSSLYPAHIDVVTQDARALPFEREIAHETKQFGEIHADNGMALLTLMGWRY
ncbi:MAG: hypothetical protein O3A01_01165 [bacterium]|nr:hypothetical protein [bacterium]